MIKKMTFRKISITTLLLLLAFLLYHYPENISEEMNNEEQGIYYYRLNSDNMLEMTTINCNTNSLSMKIERIIDTFLNDEDKMLPEGVKLLSYAINDNLLKIDFSKEFLNMTSDMEEKIIETLVYSFTSLEEIDKIMIFVEGERLEELPNSHKKLDLYLDKSWGINKVYDIDSFHDVNMNTLYYLNENHNYVPVSYFYNDSGNHIKIIIEQLKSYPFLAKGLSGTIDYELELMNYDLIEDTILLYFNDVLLNSVKDGKLEEELKYSVGWSIIDSLDVKRVEFYVNNEKIDEIEAVGT